VLYGHYYYTNIRLRWGRGWSASRLDMINSISGYGPKDEFLNHEIKKL